MFQIAVYVEVKELLPHHSVWAVVGTFDWDGEYDSLEKILQKVPMFNSINVNVRWRWEVILKVDSSLFTAALTVIDLVRNSQKGE